MVTLKTRLTTLLQRKKGPVSCDTCAFVDFFRSNGDGPTARPQAFCRCPGGSFENRPIPNERRSARWEQSPDPVGKPWVGDPTLTV